MENSADLIPTPFPISYITKSIAVQLNGDNYRIWKQKITTFFEVIGLLYYFRRGVLQTLSFMRDISLNFSSASTFWRISDPDARSGWKLSNARL